MATLDNNQQIWGHANIISGAVGADPATAIGYSSRDGIIITAGKTTVRHFNDNLKGPGLIMSTERRLMVSVPFLQFDAALMALAMGIAEVGQLVTGGGALVNDVQLSLKVVTTLIDGTNWQIKLYSAVSVDDVAWTIGQNEPSLFTSVFEAEDHPTNNMFEVLRANGNIVSTLSTGVLTRTADEGYHKVASEVAGAADVLDSITGAGLVDDETLRLQINSVLEPITLTDLAGTLELTGSADWTMTNLDDYIDLQYDLSGTKWEEIGRHDAT